MNESMNIPTKMIRENNHNQRNQINLLMDLDNSDTSSDYNQNYIYFPNNETKIIPIIKIRNYNDKQIEKNIELNKDDNLSWQQKKIKYLAEKNSSSENDDYDNNFKVNDNESESLFFYEESSTKDSSYSLVDPFDEKKKYWIKYNLYDNVVNNDNKKRKLPKKKQIDVGKYFYFYLNDLNTYFFTKSVLLGGNEPINDEKYAPDECQLNESVGLFFCGKTIKYNNESTECSPNIMICKNCMQKNQKRYNLKRTYLININGRVAKKVKGKDKDKRFHCFGHFLFGKIQIENCINKFSCQACKLLNKYEEYYFQ